MPEWWTYRLSDFLLFSPRTYYRMIERLNEAVWPAQLLTVALGCMILMLLYRSRGPQQRIIWTTLALLWLWIAWAFLWRRYVAINWALVYILPLFVLEALLLLFAGWSGKIAKAGSRRLAPKVGYILLAVAFLLYPALATLLGRSWRQAEIFGIAPDPTAIATLGLALLVPSRFPRVLMAVPILWCLISGLTLWALGSYEAWLPPAAALVSILAAWGFGHQKPRTAGTRTTVTGRTASSRTEPEHMIGS